MKRGFGLFSFQRELTKPSKPDADIRALLYVDIARRKILR